MLLHRMTIADHIIMVSNNLPYGLSSTHLYNGELKQLIKRIGKEEEITNDSEHATDDETIILYRFIEEKLGLRYLSGQDNDSNVCFANSKELQDAYKTTFSPIDLLDYIYSTLHTVVNSNHNEKSIQKDCLKALYPSDTEAFWQGVKSGRELRKK